MSERPTIGLFKEKIAHARQLAEKIGDGRRLDEPPPSLFDDRQLERWQAAEPIITSTVVKVMKDQGFSNFDLQQDWSRAAKELSFKQVDFTLIFSKGEDGTGEDRQIKFRFDAGGRRFKNWVSARTALAVPRGYSFSEEFKLEKVLGLIAQPNANSLVEATVKTRNVTEQNVETLLLLAIAGLKEQHNQQ